MPPSVVVDDLDIDGSGVGPGEADSVLVVDPDRVLPTPVAGEFFQSLHPALRLGCLAGLGSMVGCALEAGHETDATVVNMRFVKPIDREIIIALAREHSLLISVEENAAIGGAGSEVARVLEEIGSQSRFVRLGLPDKFIEHGDQALLLASVGLDKDGIVRAITENLI